jgi:p-hydroxybenzoate 3-monooxygenase
MSSKEQTPVVIIGAGVAGLTLATFLRSSGVECVVLERRDRAYLQTVRQRAGVVDARNVQMFERWGFAEKLLAGPVAQTIDYRTDGVSRIFDITGDDASTGRFCTQQMLVNNLLRVLIDEMGGDVRFEASDVTIQNEEGTLPQVSYRDANGTHQITCDYIAGCDADRGVSRASIPDGVLTTVTHEFGYAWLAVLVASPVKGHPVMGVSRHGFVAQLPRGPQRSRYYLQCALTDNPADWPEQRIWDEIRLRMNDASIENAMVHETDFVPLRSVVHFPMQHGRLFLAGDAAHLVPPTGAKGMNLALFDVDTLSLALVQALCQQDLSALESYSDTILPRLWRYQEFSAWMTDTMHDAGDASIKGNFRQMTARARLDELFNSDTAARLHSEYQRGTA